MKDIVPDEVILGLIKAKPSHGYFLMERFNSPEYLGRIWTMSTSQIYAVLKRLEKSQAIRGKTVSTGSGPHKKVYSITEQGEKQLQTWLYDPHPSTSIHRIRVLFLSRLYVSNLLGMPSAPILTYQKSVCLEQLSQLKSDFHNTQSTIEKLTLDFVIGQLDAAINWLEKTERSSTKINLKIPTQT